MSDPKRQAQPGFWRKWQGVSAKSAIFHQWDQLEKTGCIDNFRILAEGKAVFRRGWYFADSDAFKWLEAAFIILSDQPDPQLLALVDRFVDLIQRAQARDGYLYTFNQIHFPDVRWVNLQVEHELYCHGHLIEAFVSGAQIERFQDKLEVASKAADCIVAGFKDKGPAYTPGHEEIEIALLRLFEVTHKQDYLDMAGQFLEKRGKGIGFGLKLARQAARNDQRVKTVKTAQVNYQNAHPASSQVTLPEINNAKKPANIQRRWVLNTLSGKFFQQHKPLKKHTKPVGHSVRFAYLQTAAAMYDRLTDQKIYLKTLEKCWIHMVEKRMYITGGLGSLPVIEGFGRDYELDPEYAYTETCAALGSLFWNREMAKLTGQACYSDLYEWQLYNAALVGMGIDGKSYFYNNPLAVHGNIERRSWYEVPCCPSNLSRTLGNLQKDAIIFRGNAVELGGYISGQYTFEIENEQLVLEMESDLPWEGKVQINFQKTADNVFVMKLRQPSWAGEMRVFLNGDVYEDRVINTQGKLNPAAAQWITIERLWKAGDRIDIKFGLPVRILRADERVKSVSDKAVLARGPLVYCLESIDNPGVDIFSARINKDRLQATYDSEKLGGCWVITAESAVGDTLTFIPYHLWGNRGPSQMTVFVNIMDENCENSLAA